MDKLYFRPQRSYLFIGILFFFHLLAGLAIFLSDLSVWLQLIGILLLAISFWHSIRRYFMQQGKNIIQCFWQQHEQWYLSLSSGQVIAANPQPGSYVTPWLTIINFKQPQANKHYVVILWCDSLAPREFKQLRVAIQRAIR